jgi:putative ribosome biogenesis GTPase RsgA
VNTELQTGQVLYGINNIYTVEVDGRQMQCRIKGKILKTERNVYNPIAVGDFVRLQPDPHSEEVGWIVERRPRTSSLVRWNKKRNAIQVLAANAEILVCVKKKVSVFFGQSGVGKSTLLNRMFPGLDLVVGDISRKYDRGSHTTSFASLIRTAEDFPIIDTPGIRELEIAGVEARDLAFYFPEFVPIAEQCSYPSCRHVDEPECAVRQAVDRGLIHPDRYESYLRIYEDVEAFARAFPGSPYA